MVISTEKKFIFFAFNKTGTTSIENVLGHYENRTKYLYLSCKYKFLKEPPVFFKHVRPWYIKQLMGDKAWGNYFTFSFVRNPWDRAVSLYFYHRKSPEKWPLARGDFASWVRGGGTGSARKSMSEFICDDKGKTIIDFIGKYENLEGDFIKVCNQIGLATSRLPHLNQSTAGDYHKYYTPETRDIVGSWSKADIEKFGYEF